jgi:hypothetical protein
MLAQTGGLATGCYPKVGLHGFSFRASPAIVLSNVQCWITKRKVHSFGARREVTMREVAAARERMALMVAVTVAGSPRS